ncbi:MAG: flagellin [Alphaproteobacteria bacterium]|jgi:flagellin
MPITINTNISAMISQRNLASASNRSASSLAKLSSGSRVPTAKDDAAALAVGTGLKIDVTALKAAQVNAQQATSVLQIADGAFGQIGDILNRMKSLATTAQSEQLSSTELGFLNQEFGLLNNEIDRIAGTTQFNGIDLLGGSNTITLGATIGTDVETADGFVGFSFDDSKVTAADVFEVGYDAGADVITVRNNNTNSSQSISLSAAPAAGETATLNFSDIGVSITLNDQFNAAASVNNPLAGAATSQFNTAAGTAAVQADLDFQVGINAGDIINVQVDLGSYQELVGAGVTIQGVDTQANAVIATGQVDLAVDSVNAARANLGSNMNKLEFANSNLSVTIENTEAARSTLMDVDVSSEITKFTSEQVLIQAGVSMLAQANQQPSLLLRLLQ